MVQDYILRQCHHKRDEVQIGGHFILASEWFYDTDINLEPVPDLGIYLHSGWDKFFEPPQIIGEPEGFGSINQAIYPVIIVPWADQGVISMPMLNWLMEGIKHNLAQGKLIEIGCLGGHGRTGTLLACILGFVEELSAHEAIKTLRLRYCKKAVESKAQAKLIAEYLGSDIELAEAEVHEEWKAFTETKPAH